MRSMRGVEIPTGSDEPDAYVLPAREEYEDEEDEWPPQDRAAVIQAARRERLEEAGLPVDPATLERVDAVMDPDYPRYGLYFTWEECKDDVPDEVVDRVRQYLDDRPAVDGGLRLGWRAGRRIVTVGVAGDPGLHERALVAIDPDRVVVEPVPRSVGELEALCDRIQRDPVLTAAGYQWMSLAPVPHEGVVRVDVVGGGDEATARAFLLERYGLAVRVAWLGASRRRAVPHPFASWTSEDRQLLVFFGLDLNGQRFGSATVVGEHGDRVVVAVTRLQPIGCTTRIGGFKPTQAGLTLSAPVGDRVVIDASTGEARPSVAELRRERREPG